MQPSALPPRVAAVLDRGVRCGDGTAVPLVVRLWVRVQLASGDWQQALQLAFRLVAAELSSLMPRLLYLDTPADPTLQFGGPAAT